MKKPGEHVRVNFGHSPFVFDINGMMLVRSFNNFTLPRLSHFQYPPPYMIMPQPLLMPQPMYLPGAIVFPLLLDGEGRNLLDNSTTSMTLLWDDADTLKLEQQSTHEKIKQTRLVSMHKLAGTGLTLLQHCQTCSTAGRNQSHSIIGKIIQLSLIS